MLPAGPQIDPPSVAAARLQQVIEARFADGIAAALTPQAAGPGPGDAESLRRAYLDLLKLCLTDLAATTTTSVARTREGVVMSRELAGEQLRLRAAGLDWPLHGLTMVGLRRLEDLERCVETVVADGVPGDVIEAGSWRGGASMFIRAVLDTLGEGSRRLWVADSFQGFPAAPQDAAREADGYSLSEDLAGIDFLAIPLEEVRATFARFGLDHDVRFVPGFFQDTLPGLVGGQWSIVRLDGDTYDSIRVGLDALYPGLAPGGYLVIDDYSALEECRAAVEDYRREHGITEPIELIDWSGARWRRTSPVAATASAAVPAAVSAAGPATGPDAPPAGESAVRSVPRPPRERIPAIEEVELREELARVRDHLAAAQADVRRLTSSPLVGPVRWARAQRDRRAGGRR